MFEVKIKSPIGRWCDRKWGPYWMMWHKMRSLLEDDVTQNEVPIGGWCDTKWGPPLEGDVTQNKVPTGGWCGNKWGPHWRVIWHKIKYLTLLPTFYTHSTWISKLSYILRSFPKNIHFTFLYSNFNICLWQFHLPFFCKSFSFSAIRKMLSANSVVFSFY